MTRKLSVVLLVVFCSLPAFGQTVAIQDGNVVLKMEERVRQLTRSGQDIDPSLSPDGNWAIFVRRDPSRILDRMSESGEGPSTSIWVVRTDGSGERMLLQEGASGPDVPYYGGYAVPQFLSDSNHFVFLSEQSFVSAVVGRSDLNARKTQLVCGGNSLEVLRSGEYKDHLIVLKHKYFLGAGGGTYDWYWLVDTKGTEVGPIGDDSNVQMFKEGYADLESSESR